MNIACIILHYKNIRDTNECLSSLDAVDWKDIHPHIFLVCNDAFEQKKKRSLPITILHQRKNIGFAKGMNIGIQEALKDPEITAVVLLNNDVIVAKNFSLLFEHMKAEIRSPVISFKWNNTLIYDHGGYIHPWTGRTKHYEATHAGMKTGKVDFVSGCCMVVHRKIFETIGFLDERFFFYFEDVDFCFRALHAGFSIRIIPHVVLFHKLSASIGRSSRRAIRYNIIGHAKFVQKHFGLRQFIGYGYLLALSGKILWNSLWKH